MPRILAVMGSALLALGFDCTAIAAETVSTPVSAPIPFKHDTLATPSVLGGSALGVLVISVIAIAVVLFVRKRLNLNSRGETKPRLLRVLETQRLGPRTLLSVVEFAGSHYLIAQGENGVSCLASTPHGSTSE